MRITIQVVCDDVEDAKRVIAKLAAPDSTWVAQLEQTGSSVPKVAEKSRSSAVNSSTAAGATDAPRPNTSPGEPSIGKIGKDNVDLLVRSVLNGARTHQADKWTEHMKLLWKRGLVKYDGEEYYL